MYDGVYELDESRMYADTWMVALDVLLEIESPITVDCVAIGV